MIIFLGIDVSKFRHFIKGVDLKQYPDEEVHPCLREEEDKLYLGIYMKGRYTLGELQRYSRKIQSWLKRHNLGGIAYHADVSTEGYRLIFIEGEGDEIKNWICQQQ